MIPRKLTITCLLTLFVAICVTGQTANNPFSLFVDTSSVAAGSSNTITMCADQNASGSGNFQAIQPGTVLTFRFGPGFGTVTAFGSAQLVNYPNSPAGTIALTDFDTTTNLANGKVTMKFNALSSRTIGFRQKICVSADWTAPVTPTIGEFDFSNNAFSLGSPQTVGHVIFAK
jgi:hypothetical protein